MPGHVSPRPHRIFSKAAYLFSARGIRELLQAAFFVYLARVSAATYGEFMLALGLGSILLMVSEFGLNLPLVSMLREKGGTPREALVQVSLLKVLLLGLASLGAVGFLYWQDYSRPLTQVVLVISAGMGLDALTGTFFVGLQVQGRQDMEGKIRVLGAGLGFGYGLIGLLLGAPPLILAFFKLIETLANLAGGVWLGLSRTPGRWRLPSVRRLGDILKRGMIFALLEVTAIIYNRANLFFLQKYAGAEGVGQYSATWQVVDCISCLVSNLLLQSVMFPLFVQLWEVDKKEVSRLAQDTARWLLAAALLIMFVLAVESDRLIPLIFGPQYRDAVWMQRYLVITIVSAFLHNLAAFLMISMHLERLLLIFYLAGLIINLFGCATLIPLNPLMGACLAIVLTKGGVALLSVSYCQHRLGLIPRRTLGQLAGAGALGFLLYLAGTALGSREVAEALAMAPLLGLMWHWWRQRGKRG